MLKIDGSPIPSPSALRVSVEDPAATHERSASGRAVKDFLPGKRRLRLKWAHLTPAQLAALLRAVDARFFDAAFPDPATGEEAEASCWCGARSVGLLRMRDGAPVWTDIEMEWNER